MSVVFAYRSTQTAAWYSNGGSAMGQSRQSSTAALVVTSVSSEVNVFGSKYLAKASSSLTRAPIWPGRANTPSGTAFAAIVRIVPRWTGTPPTVDLLVLAGTGGTTPPATINLIILTTGAFRLRYADGDGGTSVTSTSTVATYTSYVSGTAVDIMVTWDGTTNAGAVKWSVEGVEIGTSTAPSTFFSGLQNVRTAITSGVGVSSTFSNFDLNEIVIFDNAQNHVYSARTDFWSLSTFDGSVYTDPGIANVRLNTAYTFAGTAETGSLIVPARADVRNGTGTDNTTGTLDLPTVATVETGVTFDGATKTGTYDGSDRWSDPGVGNVVSGVVYKANSTSNNRTGTFVGSYTDPGVANVRAGTTYTYNSVLLTGTMAAYPQVNTRNWAPSDTQVAIFNVLSNDSVLAGLLQTTVGGTQKIFDHVPDNLAFPFLSIAIKPWKDRGNYTYEGVSGEVWIHTWYQAGSSPVLSLGDKAVQAIQKRIDELIHKQPIAISGWKNLILRRSVVNILNDPDNVTKHGVQQFKILLGG